MLKKIIFKKLIKKYRQIKINKKKLKKIYIIKFVIKYKSI